MRVLTYILVVISICSFNAQAQNIGNLPLRTPSANSDNFYENQSQASFTNHFNWDNGSFGYSVLNKNQINLRLSPVVNATHYLDNSVSQTNVQAGINLHGDLTRFARFDISGVYSDLFGDSLATDYSYKSAIRTHNINPLFDNLDIHAKVQVKPNKYFTITGGIDNYFIGNGINSLLLNDAGGTYPFVSLKTKVWRFELLNLYQFLKDETPQGKKLNKYTSTHYLSTQLGRGFNLSLFETIVFQPKDTLQNRGYELEYLNPILFYRPTEYSLGSSDNVLLGVNLNWTRKNTMIYSQMVVDDFSVKEIRAKSKWWANKYGFQLGVKSKTKLFKNPLTLQTELNVVRPFTYTHLNESQNYANNGFPLAHQAGANFIESHSRIAYYYKKFTFKLAFIAVQRGAEDDVEGLTHGANVYDPYTERPEEYGYKIGGYGKLMRYRTSVEATYQLPTRFASTVFLKGIYEIQQSKDIQTDFGGVYFGVRTNLWKDKSFNF